MDIDLDEMGLIDSTTEYINISDAPQIIYTENGSINVGSEDVSSLDNRVTIITLPSFIQIVQDGNSENIGYLIDNNQLPLVNRALVVDDDAFVELNESSVSAPDVSTDLLQKQLSQYLSSPSVVLTHDRNKNPEKTITDHAETQVENNEVISMQEEEVSGQAAEEPKNELLCKTCNLEFPNSKLFNRHRLIHIEDKPFKCNMCHESFNYEINLDLHVATHNVDKPFCPVCKRTFGRIAGLKAHIILHVREESLFCNLCGEEFNSLVFLKEHLLEHETGFVERTKKIRPTEYKCNHCDLMFDSFVKRREHMLKMHRMLHSKKSKKHNKNKGKPKRRVGRGGYECEFCRKCFDKPSQLQRHKRIHTGERPYKCEICNRGFTQKGSLRIHMLKHTRERPYVCQYCKGSFSQKGNLQAHVKRLHAEPDGDERIYKCELCSCIFRKVGSLNAHFTKIHSSDYIVSDTTKEINSQSAKDDIRQVDACSDSSNKENESEKSDIGKLSNPLNVTSFEVINYEKTKVSCDVCSKEFSTPGELLNHAKSHSQEKPFQCKVCPKSFTLQTTLAEHQKTHSIGQKYECNICDKRYSNIHCFKFHKKKHLILEKKKKLAAALENKEVEEDGNESEKNSGRIVVEPEPLDSLHQVDISSLDGSFILTENGNIIDLSSDIEEVDDAPFACSVCDMTFETEGLLAGHLEVHGTNTYRCDHCPCFFNSKRTLRKHLIVHKNPADVPGYFCKICDKVFMVEHIFLRHQEMHESGFPWRCPECGWSFKSHASCKKHIVVVHGSQSDLEPIKIQNKLNLEVDDKESSLPANPTLSSSDQTSEVLKDFMSLQPQVYITATEDGGIALSTVPQKLSNQDNHFQEFPLVLNEEKNLVINATVSENNQKQLFENSLETCIFTLEPSVELNESDPVLDSNLAAILPQSQTLHSLADLSVHKSNHLQEKPHTCITCEKSFASAVEYEEHLKLHLKKSVKVAKKGSRLIQTRDSKKSSLLALKPNFTCRICSMKFVALKDLTNHEAVHSNEVRQNKYKCDVCSSLFSTSEQLQEHSKEHYANGETLLNICPHCDVEFETEEEYQNHQNNDKCSQLIDLDIKKKSRTNWRPEVRRLTEEETKVLSTISSEGATVSERVLLQSLKEKEKYQHRIKTEEKPQETHRHVCKYCPKSFRKPSDLIRHLRIHTGERPYQCAACHKSFSIKSTASSHMKTHTKDKSYKCFVCMKPFATTGSLKIHMRLHTGLKPFSCDLCGATFRTSGHKKSHLSKHLKELEEAENKEKIASTNADNTASAQTKTLISETLSSSEGSQYLFPIKPGTSTVDSLTMEKSEDFASSLKALGHEEVRGNTTKNSRYLYNISDEGGGNGDTPRYFLSIKDSSTAEDEFVLETLSDDQIMVTIPKDPSDVSKSSNQDSLGTNFHNISVDNIIACNMCGKFFSKKISLEKHMKKQHPQHFHECMVCFERFNQKADLDLHILAHELDREFSCSECAESFSLEEELRAHKCIKTASLDLSLDHDIFLMCNNL